MARDRIAPVPIMLGTPLEPVYRLVVRARNRSFDAGRRVQHVTVPVISVGNLSVGGTGKSPMVRWVVRALQQLGRRPGVAMRGYGAERTGKSDEQMEHTERLPGVPIVADPKRVNAARTLIERHGVDCIVLDDGFQHRFLARDLDIVLIDATRDPFADRCLPAGWLREPVASLARAGAVVLTRCDHAAPAALDRLQANVLSFAPGAPVARARHAWSGVETVSGVMPPSWLAGRRVVIACAIGNPNPFIDQVRAHSAIIVGRVIRPDHHRWNTEDARAVLARRAGTTAVLLTTHKDWVKWRRLGDPWIDRAAARPVVDLDFAGGGEPLRRALAGAIGRRADSVV